MPSLRATFANILIIIPGLLPIIHSACPALGGILSSLIAHFKNAYPAPIAHTAHKLSLQWLLADFDNQLDIGDFATTSSPNTLTFAANNLSCLAPTPSLT